MHALHFAPEGSWRSIGWSTSPVREYRPPGSVRGGALGNRRPYLDNAERAGKATQSHIKAYL